MRERKKEKERRTRYVVKNLRVRHDSEKCTSLKYAKIINGKEVITKA